MGHGFCMGLSLFFLVAPAPPVDIADNRLSSPVDVDVLHRDLLLASSPVSLERLHLRREGPGELVEGAFGAVLLRDVVHWSCPGFVESYGLGRAGGSWFLSKLMGDR